jgi:hypothetical protein
MVSSMSITIAAGGVSQQRVTDTTTTGLDLFGDDHGSSGRTGERRAA